MQSLSEHQLLTGLISVSTILLAGRGTAEIAKRIGQPEVFGELLGGFVLGPSIFGAIFPQLQGQLFGDPGLGLAFSLFAWTGAILLLIVAGAEVDLSVLSQHKKAGAFAAVFTVIPSIFAGAIFGHFCLGLNYIASFFLGGVLSVTAVSVIAKILIERGALRRSYAQIIMAAGIASEVAIWPLISTLSALHAGDTWLTGLRTTAFGILFFVAMLTIGQKFIDLVMRRMADSTKIIYGQLSLLVLLGFVFAQITECIGLHALLGPFVFGMLIGRAPRATTKLKDSLQAMTMSVFAPVFFVSAGMRVDVTKLLNPHSLLLILAIFAVGFLTKVVFGFIGGKLGGLRTYEAVLVGIGANMRGGTDVIVAILGGTLGVINEATYSMYAMAAIITVFVSPPLISYLSSRVPPTEEELIRLSKEEAKRRAYLSGIERVLLPTFPDLYPADCVPILQMIASTKEAEHEVFDIVEIEHDSHTVETRIASDVVKKLGESGNAEYGTMPHSEENICATVLKNSETCDLIVLGAKPQLTNSSFTFGHLQDAIIDNAKTDVLVIAQGKMNLKQIRRVLVPVNGMEYSMAAADIGAYVSKACEAELVLMHIVSEKNRETSKHSLMRDGLKVLKETKFRTRRLDIVIQNKVLVSENVAAEIVIELKKQSYDLVLLGVVDRSADAALHLGQVVEKVRLETNVPTGVLVFHERSVAHNNV